LFILFFARNPVGLNPKPIKLHFSVNYRTIKQLLYYFSYFDYCMRSWSICYISNWKLLHEPQETRATTARFITKWSNFSYSNQSMKNPSAAVAVSHNFWKNKVWLGSRFSTFKPKRQSLHEQTGRIEIVNLFFFRGNVKDRVYMNKLAK